MQNVYIVSGSMPSVYQSDLVRGPNGNTNTNQGWEIETNCVGEALIFFPPFCQLIHEAPPPHSADGLRRSAEMFMIQTPKDQTWRILFQISPQEMGSTRD